MRLIPIYRPFLPPRVRRYAHDAIDSGWISSHGPYVERATEALKKRFGYKHVLLTCNGTAAGHLVARVLKVLRPKVERIFVPGNVYVAAWNTLLHEYRPDQLVALDADPATWVATAPETVDSYGVERSLNPDHDAILAVHNVSAIAHVPRLAALGCTVIEDNCEGLFGLHGGSITGSASLCSSVSFFANKTLGAGEGGAFVTSDDAAYDIACSMANQGITSERYRHNYLATNYRMTNVAAALLYGQLQAVDEIRTRKARIFKRYREAFAGADRIACQATDQDTESSDWMMAVRITGAPGFTEADKFFRAGHVETRPMFRPITHHAHLKSVRTSPEGLPVSERLCREVVVLPSHPLLTEEEIETVIDLVFAWAESCR